MIAARNVVRGEMDQQVTNAYCQASACTMDATLQIERSTTTTMMMMMMTTMMMTMKGQRMACDDRPTHCVASNVIVQSNPCVPLSTPVNGDEVIRETVLPPLRQTPQSRRVYLPAFSVH